MRLIACAALAAAAAALGGCQSTGSTIDPNLTSFCTQNGFGRPGEALYEQCLEDHSLAGRKQQLDPRSVGKIGT